MTFATSVCHCVYVCVCGFSVCVPVSVTSSENHLGILQMSRNHISSPKEPKDAIRHTLTYSTCICYTRPSCPDKQFLKPTHCCLALRRTHTRAHTHAPNHNGRLSLTHKHTPLCFQTKACFCSFVMIPQKTSLAEREVLTGI